MLVQSFSAIQSRVFTLKLGMLGRQLCAYRPAIVSLNFCNYVFAMQIKYIECNDFVSLQYDNINGIIFFLVLRPC